MVIPSIRLVLASSSRYRKDLLLRLGMPFSVASPGIDETPLSAELPGQTALRLAVAKAQAVAIHHPNAMVIGSDQVADSGGVAIGKSGSRDRAIAQLRSMSGRTVIFRTGVALVNSATGSTRSELVDVISTFRNLQDSEIEAYVDREEPYDCAGSVKSEALGIALFERIQSDDPTALIGLPLIALIRLLRAEGVDVLAANAGWPS